MMNVAVVSDIGWKNATGADPTPEDVWAQYDFKCAVSDVLEYAEYLGMDIREDAHLLWIADEALQAPEPQGWEQRLDPKGGVYYYHPTTGMSLNQHPLDHHYQQFYLQMKAQYDAMYTAEKKQKEAAQTPGGDAGASGTATPSMSTTADGMSEAAHAGARGDLDEAKGGILGKLFAGGKSKGGPQEEMFELEVDLHRQQDGLGIGLTLDNIIVEVEAGGSARRAGRALVRRSDHHGRLGLAAGDGLATATATTATTTTTTTTTAATTTSTSPPPPPPHPLHLHLHLQGRMLKDVIVPKRVHKLVVRYSRMSNGATSPRRSRARRVTRSSSRRRAARRRGGSRRSSSR